MDNNIHLNPHCVLHLRKYEKHLSPFGLTVLANLYKIKNEARKKVEYLHSSTRRPHKNKRILTFNDTYTAKTPSILHETAIGDNTINNIDKLSNVSTSIDLIKTLYNENEGDDAENSVKAKKQFEDTRFSSKENSYTIDQQRVDLNQSETIPWNDIFDSEILNGITDFENEPINNENDRLSNDLNKLFDRNVNTGNNLKKSYVINEKETENFTNTAKKNNKTVVLNKVTQNKRNSLRKEKYTKTVKKWLNDVNPKNAVELEEVLKNTDLDNGRDQESVRNKLLDTDVRYDVIKPKKTVQAQLANKDGIMKFRKPKNLLNKNVKSVEDNTPKSNAELNDFEISNDLTIKPTKVNKKVGPRFIAPIKSQIPVKDVNFLISIVNNDNFNSYKDKFKFAEDTEVILIIIYGNGFNQLNCQHTDASCVPEGLLLYFNNLFYYLQGKISNCIDVLRKIIKMNLVCYDAKDILIYLRCQFDLDHLPDLNVFDVKIGSCLINPDKPPENFSEAQKLLEYVPEFTIVTECALQKAAWYMTILKDISSKLRSSLVQNGLWKVFVEIEMKILPIVSEMQHRGVAVDMDKLKTMENILINRLKEIEEVCYKAAGKAFQINSTVQVRSILYDELKLDTKSNVKIRETICKGAKSTSESMLRSLIAVHPLPKLILEYRHLHKAHATFLSGIAQHVTSGIVKPIWDQTAAATGRIASNNPNLQAIPKTPFNLVLFPKEAHDGPLSNQTLNFRSVYVARAGYSVLAADFKHIECRVFAQAAADCALLSALDSPDLFRVLAAQWLKKPENEVSSEDRERTKRIVYASLYGAGTRKLMEILNLGYDQVLSIMTSFNRTFPSLKSFGRSVVVECEKRNGRLTIASGRARTFNNIDSLNFTEKSHAERQAVNFIIQGTAADLCKTAMILTTERLRRAAPPVEGHLLLQIHDELVWEVAERDLQRAAAIIKETMENCGLECGMGLKLPVALYRGPDWGHMEELY